MDWAMIMVGTILLVAAIAAGFIPVSAVWWSQYRGIAPIGMGLWIGAAISLIIIGAVRLQ